MTDSILIEYKGARIDRRAEEFFITSDRADIKEKGTFSSEDQRYFVGTSIDKLKSSEAFMAMVISEKVLAKEWDTPEEDEAWGHL